MVDQKCFKVHITVVIPPIMIISSVLFISKDKESYSDILSSLEFIMVAKIQDGGQKVTQLYKVVIMLLVQELSI